MASNSLKNPGILWLWKSGNPGMQDHGLNNVKSIQHLDHGLKKLIPQLEIELNTF